MGKKKSLIKPRYPSCWIGDAKSGMHEIIFVSDFGRGDLLARFWIPEKKRDWASLKKTIESRMKKDFGYELGHWSRIVSKDNPFLDKLTQKRK